MKIAILLFILFIIFCFYRYIYNTNKKNESNIQKEKIVDLEKDPKTDEYKPKD